MGTKSVLFGAHCWCIHPWFVAAGWTKLYGFPWDPRLWLAFFVHDLGYWGKPEMDNEDGENHVFLGARVMERLFGLYWGHLCLFHSRFMAKRFGCQVSKLCFADKLAICYTPWWLYLPMTYLSGELPYYMALAVKRTKDGEPRSGKYSAQNLETASPLLWYKSMQSYLIAWVAAHKDGADDTWTPNAMNGGKCEFRSKDHSGHGGTSESIDDVPAYLPTVHSFGVDDASAVQSQCVQQPSDTGAEDAGQCVSKSGDANSLGSQSAGDAGRAGGRPDHQNGSDAPVAFSAQQCREDSTGSRLPWLSQTGREPAPGTFRVDDHHRQRDGMD